MSSHHHHRRDDASVFKRRQLAAIERRKTFTKIAKVAIIALAVLMGVLVVVSYLFG